MGWTASCSPMPCLDLMREFNKQVNAGIVDPQFIASVRKKLALVKLLKVLDRHPDLLNEVRAA